MIRIFYSLMKKQMLWHILNGPTTDTWIDPMIEYLRQLKVKLHNNSPVTKIRFNAESGLISGVEVNGELHEAGAYFIAVPSERLAPLLDATPELLRAAPSLEHVKDLPTKWMNGIQYYLNNTTNLDSHGHVAFWDSPAALTGLSQGQFWTDKFAPSTYGNGDVKSIISFCISDWEQKYDGVAAKDCKNARQVAELMWLQMHNEQGAQELFPKNMSNVLTFHLDDSITWDEEGNAQSSMPLFVNEVNTLPDRPMPITNVANLFVGGDFTNNAADLATMESANVSARVAVGGIMKFFNDKRDEPVVPDYSEAWPSNLLIGAAHVVDRALLAVGHDPIGWNEPPPVSAKEKDTAARWEKSFLKRTGHFLLAIEKLVHHHN
jgi:uncharacterized protein with NAD-binding domain and iron-sulfur cluster